MILNAEEFPPFVPSMYSSALPGEQQQEPEHCEHECVCPDYFDVKFPCDGILMPDFGKREKCKHDTRSCPRKPAPETRREFLTKQNIEQFKEQEREKVLDELTSLIDNSKEYGSQDRMELFHYTVLNGMIDSLRNKEQP